MIIAHLGEESPQQHRPQGARSIDRSPFVHPGKPWGTNPQPTEATPTPAVEAPALALQRIRSLLELAAIAAGCSQPEQVAAALLGEGVAL